MGEEKKGQGLESERLKRGKLGLTVVLEYTQLGCKVVQIKDKMSGLGLPGTLPKSIKGMQFGNSTDFFNPYLFDARLNLSQSQWQTPLFLPNLLPFGSLSTQIQNMNGYQKATKTAPGNLDFNKHQSRKLGGLLQNTKSKKLCQKPTNHQNDLENSSNKIPCTICDLNPKLGCSEHEMNYQQPTLADKNIEAISKQDRHQTDFKTNQLFPRFTGVKGNLLMWPNPAANLLGTYPWMALSQLMISSQIMANKINSCGGSKIMTPPKDLFEPNAVKRPFDDCVLFGKQFSGIPSPTNAGFAQYAKRQRMDLEHLINLEKNVNRLQSFPPNHQSSLTTSASIHQINAGSHNCMQFSPNTQTSISHSNTPTEVSLPKKEVVADDLSNLTADKLANGKFCNARLQKVFAGKSSSNCRPGMSKEKKAHRCMYCGKLYSRKYGLKIHIRTHTGYKPLKCKVCGRPFGDPSNLNKHVRLHAEGETPYRCEFCGKVLVRRRDLERHIKSRHPEQCHPLYAETDILCPPADPRLWTKS